MRIILIVSLCLAFLSVGAFSAPTPATWEYKTEDRCFDEGRINALGAQGWELAGLTALSTGGRACVFKRAK